MESQLVIQFAESLQDIDLIQKRLKDVLRIHNEKDFFCLIG
jgi:hypothetical protein